MQYKVIIKKIVYVDADNAEEASELAFDDFSTYNEKDQIKSVETVRGVHYYDRVN